MEIATDIQKNLFVHFITIFSATVALNISLFIYALHDYFNLFGVKHAAIFTVLVFYGLAAAGYYFLYFKDLGRYQMPTLGAKVLSLIFYTSVGLVTFFAFKICITSPLDYVLAFFASCVIGGVIKDISIFAVAANKKDDVVLDLLGILANLILLFFAYMIYQYKIDEITKVSMWGVTMLSWLVPSIYYIIKYICNTDNHDIFTIIVMSTLLSSGVRIALLTIFNNIIYSGGGSVQLSMLLSVILLYIVNKIFQ